MLSPADIVQKMMANDAMSTWLGIEIRSITLGSVVLSMNVRPEMVNGFGIAHGSITYALSDTCLAFSANTHGRQAVSVETSISHLQRVNIGDELITEIDEINLSKRFGVYQVKIYNQSKDLVSVFKGTMYFREEWT